MRTIGVVTTSRADYGIYLPVLRRIVADPELRLHLIVSGTHLSPEFGLTVQFIRADGFEIGDQVEMLVSSDTPEGIAKSMGLGLIGLSQAYARNQPDLLLVLGDRYEMHAAALAALPFKIPVAHIHGGEITEGAIDDALRHSITKLSHLHFVAAEEHRRRVIQMGEEPWRVITTGSPGLDNLNDLRLLNRTEIETLYHLKLEEVFLLVTYHPVTLEFEETEGQIKQLLLALRKVGIPVVFTGSNADTSGRIIRSLVSQFVDTYPQSQMVENLGTQGYFSLMSQAAAMVGNSSSGIIEAPSIGLPVVNIGSRQRGRTRGENIIDVECQEDAIVAGVERAISPEFLAGLIGTTNPYGAGGASNIIVQHLKAVTVDQKLVAKRFVDLPSVPMAIS